MTSCHGIAFLLLFTINIDGEFRKVRTATKVKDKAKAKAGGDVPEPARRREVLRRLGNPTCSRPTASALSRPSERAAETIGCTSEKLTRDSSISKSLSDTDHDIDTDLACAIYRHVVDISNKKRQYLISACSAT